MKKYRFHIITEEDNVIHAVALNYHYEANRKVCRVSKTGISIAYDGKFYTCFEDFNIYI